jgi:hypothetical protein
MSKAAKKAAWRKHIQYRSRPKRKIIGYQRQNARQRTARREC